MKVNRLYRITATKSPWYDRVGRVTVYHPSGRLGVPGHCRLKGDGFEIIVRSSDVVPEMEDVVEQMLAQRGM